MIRPDIVLRAANHSARSAGSPSVIATTRAPNAGGFDQLARTKILSWLTTAAVVAESGPTVTRHPVRSLYNPKFFEYDWQINSGIPASMKRRIPAESWSGSPDANPRYAESKMIKKALALQRAANSFHWSAVGSTPVGLCAQACRTTEAPLGAAFKSSQKPVKSRPLSAGLKYRYVLYFSPHRSKIALWFPHVGFEERTSLAGQNLAMNSPAVRSDPVPDKHCTPSTRSSLIATLSEPTASSADSRQNSGSPPIGRYSWFISPDSILALITASAFLTTGRTHGWPEASRYAPTPRFSLSGNSSAL
mmetsp:Transcript_35709/g.93336  ORF Transcript_35709/g.93336 Transcript_35709/m.93336 type:complete len:305 (+) Transcript_35709:438-1352(+)